MTGEKVIVGLGEALFDLLPSGKQLGGAPLNSACCAQQLLAGRGGQGVVASRVGFDALGDTIVAELAGRGMRTDCVERDVEHGTGTVAVELEAGQPAYEIIRHVAWDHLEFTPAWQKLASECAAVTFGTLAQRSEKSRTAIWQFLEAAPQAVRMLDVNLRQSFFDAEVLLESCRRATIVKLNADELPVVGPLVGLANDEPAAALDELRQKFELDAVVFTRGRRGTMLVLESGAVDPPPASYEAEAGADSVGAGDACGAGVMVGWTLGLPPAEIAALANELGAFVASRCGATPVLPSEILALMK